MDDEVKDKLVSLNFPITLIDDWQPLADKLSRKFAWIGSKIDWSRACNHQEMQLKGSYADWAATINSFVSIDGIHAAIQSTKTMYYLNDSAVDFALSFPPEHFTKLLPFIVENIPLHHYFFDLEATWCLVISSEGYADFALAE